MGRNSTEESDAAVAESFCCPPKVITMLICYTSPWASFPGGSDGKESTCNAGDLSLIPGSGKIPWRRAWQPTPVFLHGESTWIEEPSGLQSMGSQIRHD